MYRKEDFGTHVIADWVRHAGVSFTTCFVYNETNLNVRPAEPCPDFGQWKGFSLGSLG